MAQLAPPGRRLCCHPCSRAEARTGPGFIQACHVPMILGTSAGVGGVAARANRRCDTGDDRRGADAERGTA